MLTRAEEDLSRLDILAGTTDVLAEASRPCRKNVTVLLARVLDWENGVGALGDHRPGRDPDRLALPHSDLGGMARPGLADEAQPPLLALGVGGAQGVAVHRRVVEGLQRDRTLHLGGGDAAEAVLQAHM